MTPAKKLKVTSMAERDTEIVEIDDYSPSPDAKSGTPLRPVFCLKNKDQIKKFEEHEDCFILEFDPFNELDIASLSFSKGFGKADADFCVIAEKGPVACRDYPHPRSTCAKFPFETTPHESHCNLCYCYVCDLTAPCRKWLGTSGGHCHAFNNEAWNNGKKVQRQLAAKS